MRNSNLDFAKALACMGVIIMHCSFPGIYGKFAAYMFKFAVPLFFMISGYFLFQPKADKNYKMENLKRKMLHIFSILLFSECLSALYFISKRFIVEGYYSFPTLTVSDIIEKCLVGTFFNGTLWFLYALFWSYLFLFICMSVSVTPPKKLNYVILGVLMLMLHIVVRIAIRNSEFYSVSIFRNALVYGLPFILIGYGTRIAEHTKWYNRFSVTKPVACFMLFIVGYAMSIAEYAITKTSLDIYIGTILYSWAIFTFCISSRKKIHNKLFIFIGEKLSLYIYIIHLFVIDAFSGISGSIIYKWSMPFIVVVICILISSLYYRIKQIFIVQYDH